MITLAIWAGDQRVGTLSHDTATGLYDFNYEPAWCESRAAFPLSPQLALPDPHLAREPGFESLPPERRSVIVRSFFQNLLPEGQALEVAAQSNGVSKSNLAGLLLALGSETAGALRVTLPQALVRAPQAEEAALRPLTREELSQRIRARSSTPFSVWDGKVRLSIAGLQDKIAVYESESQLYLVNGGQLASTVILKPAPSDPRFADLPLVEHTCMRLAAELGITTARTRLLDVPEPVLAVDRFDRMVSAAADGTPRVHRRHIVDACQAIGLSPEAKYERLYGEGAGVIHMRDGASFQQLFALASASASPLRTRSELLDRAIFNILIGNSDAHGKNWSFFMEPGGLLGLAPAYDLVDVDAFDQANMSKTFAMGVGEAFELHEVTSFELATMAHQCDLKRPFMASRIKHLTLAAPRVLENIRGELQGEGVRQEVVQSFADRLARRCEELAARAAHLRSLPQGYV